MQRVSGEAILGKCYLFERLGGLARGVKKIAPIRSPFLLSRVAVENLGGKNCCCLNYIFNIIFIIISNNII